MPESSTRSVSVGLAAASAGNCFWMGLVTTFWTGEFPPTALIELMRFLGKRFTNGRRLHRPAAGRARELIRAARPTGVSSTAGFAFLEAAVPIVNAIQVQQRQMVNRVMQSY